MAKIIYDIIEVHGGAITIERKEGEGSKFVSILLLNLHL